MFNLCDRILASVIYQINNVYSYNTLKSSAHSHERQTETEGIKSNALFCLSFPEDHISVTERIPALLPPPSNNSPASP